MLPIIISLSFVLSFAVDAFHVRNTIINNRGKSLNSLGNRWSAPENSPTPINDPISPNSGTTIVVELGKSSGISWGSDLSFRWVYVLDLDPAGEASKTGLIEKGDYIIGFGNTSLIAQDFDFVLTVRCFYCFLHDG